MKIHYVCTYRLNQEDLYLIWYNSKPDGVVVDQNGIVPAFKDKETLRDYARSLSLFFDGQDEIYNNLDILKEWLEQPDMKTINCVDFLNAWNLFGDVAKSVGDEEFDNNPQKTNGIYEKLFWGNNIPGVSLLGSTHFDPTWTKNEVEIMKETLEYGLEMFQNKVVILEK